VGDSELPLFSRRLLDLLGLPDQEHTSAQKLAELVLEDYALTVNVLRVANSFHYNRSNRAIESISHAIVVLGMRTVHKLASTLVYFLSFEHRPDSLRRLMVRSMLSAHVAGITAELRSVPGREEAYLGGMFQNLGEVLVACHSPMQHASIAASVNGGRPVDEACLQEVGFTYDQLARAVSRHWKLSSQLASIWDTTGTPTPFATLARFGNDVTRLMCTDGSRPREAGMQLLMMRYGAAFRLTEDQVLDIWERALEQARSTFAALGLKSDMLPLPAAG
jgi:HD-like signal output (HDOD) protein